MSFTTEQWGFILALLIALNTISRWTGSKDTSVSNLQVELTRLRDAFHKLRDEDLRDWAIKFVAKQDFHEEVTRIYRAIDNKENK